MFYFTFVSLCVNALKSGSDDVPAIDRLRPPPTLLERREAAVMKALGDWLNLDASDCHFAWLSLSLFSTPLIVSRFAWPSLLLFPTPLIVSRFAWPSLLLFSTPLIVSRFAWLSLSLFSTPLIVSRFAWPSLLLFSTPLIVSRLLSFVLLVSVERASGRERIRGVITIAQHVLTMQVLYI